MKKETNIIKNAVSGINMTDSEKGRLINACNQVKSDRKTFSYATKKKIAVVAVCIVLLLTMAFTAIASRQYLKTKVDNSSHIPEKSIEKNDNSVIYDSDDKGFYISCNGVSGDAEKVYFDLTLKREDGGVIVTADGENGIERYDPYGAYLEFWDGYQKEIYFLMLNDSTDTAYHFEGSTLFYNNEKQYLGKEAKLHIGGVNITMSDDRQLEVCSFNEPLGVTIDVNSTVRTVEFDVGEFTILDSAIEIKSAEISAATVKLYGDCSITGQYDFKPVMGQAYLICDTEQIPLGTKIDVGTLTDGRFTMGWITNTVIDPDNVTAIYIDGKTIKFN